MNRRNFAKSAFAAAAGAAASKGAFADVNIGGVAESSAPFKTKFAPHFGLMKASLEARFKKPLKEIPLPDQLQFFYDCGFRALEDNFIMSRPVEDQTAIAKKMEQLGMEMGVFCSPIDWVRSSYSGNRLDVKIKRVNGLIERDPKAVRKLLVARMEKTIEVGKRVNAKWCTVVLGREDPTLAPEFQFANVVDNLRYMADVCAKTGIIMVIEPLNILSFPNFYLKRIPQGYAICRAVNSPYCKILDDFHHQQINEGNIIPNFDMARSEIAYIQVGNVSGRSELNFKNIFKHLHEVGYNGIIGMEHEPPAATIEGDRKLLKAYRSVDIDA